MPKALPRIAAVAPGQTPFTLTVRWSQGGEDMIDVSRLIETFRAYAPLHADPALFAKVKVGELGTEVVWADDIDMAADTLWRLTRGAAS